MHFGKQINQNISHRSLVFLLFIHFAAFFSISTWLYRLDSGFYPVLNTFQHNFKHKFRTITLIFSDNIRLKCDSVNINVAFTLPGGGGLKYSNWCQCHQWLYLTKYVRLWSFALNFDRIRFFIPQKWKKWILDAFVTIFARHLLFFIQIQFKPNSK